MTVQQQMGGNCQVKFLTPKAAELPGISISFIGVVSTLTNVGSILHCTRDNRIKGLPPLSPEEIR